MTRRHRFGFRLSRTAIVAGLVLGCVLSLPCRCPAQDADPLAVAVALESAFVKIIQDSEVSVVSIARYKTGPAPRLERPLELRRPDGGRQDRDVPNPASPDFVPNDFGAGVIFAPTWNRAERFILTNYHVVRGGPVAGSEVEEKPGDFRLYVRYANRRGHEGRIVAADPRSDLAVLQVDAAALRVEKTDLRPIAISNQPEIRKGQFALALGNPYAIARDGSASASWGMIANISRRPAPLGPTYDDEARRRETIHHFGTLLQIDTRLSVGTSGGPVLNLKGELIGLATSLAAIDGYEKSVGYAIPIDGPMRRILDDLARGYEVEYGFLGIMPEDEDASDLRRVLADFKYPTATVARNVQADSPAALGGMQPRDVILSINGAPVAGKADLMRMIGLMGPEVSVNLRVLRERSTRGQREVPLTIRLGKWPVADEEGIVATASRREKWRGITVDYSSSRQKHLTSDQMRYYRAVVVTRVDSPEEDPKRRVVPGDLISRVNGTPVATPAEFEKVVRGLDGDVALDLTDGRRIVVKK